MVLKPTLAGLLTFAGLSLSTLAILGLGVAQEVNAPHESFQPPKGAFIVGFREAATHRPTPPSIPSTLYRPMQSRVDVYLRVSPSGQVLEVRGIDAAPAEIAAVKDTALHLHYTPFKGATADAWVQDTLELAAPENVAPFPPTGNLAEVTMQLARSACFGSCPSYSVDITGTGRVTYRGGDFVSIAGTHTAQISPEAAQELLARFRAANFFALQDSYNGNIDSSPNELSLTIGNRRKTILHWGREGVNMPAVVTQLEDAVDAASDSARWVSSSPATVEVMRNAHIDFKSEQATRILRAAVHNGDIVTVSSLLSSGVPTTIPPSSNPNSPGTNALAAEPLLAVALNSPADSTKAAIFDLLLHLDNIGTTAELKQEALGVVVAQGRADLARILIAAGADPTKRFVDRHQWQNVTYLMLAASSGIWAMVDDALARPHDIHAVDSEGFNAIGHIFLGAVETASHEDVFPIVDRLLAAGADSTDLDPILAQVCRLDWVKPLVARGGNINARDSKGQTPLFQSCTVEGVHWLLEHGADPTLRNNDGKTAIDAAYPVQSGQEDPRAALIRQYLAQHPRL